MCEILKLSPYFLVSLFQEWMLLKELCNLDSAFCNRTNQAVFRHIVKITASDPMNTELLLVAVTSPLRKLSVQKYCLDPNERFQLNILVSMKKRNIVNTVIVLDLTTLTMSAFLAPMIRYRDPDNGGSILSSYSGLLENGGYAMQSFIKSDVWVKTDCVFLGRFDKDLFRSGYGTMIWNTGDFKQYSGNWDLGDIYGFGNMVYSNGDRYEGLWDTFANDGGGTMTYSHGQVQCGLWNDDQFYMGSSSYSDGRNCQIHMKLNGEGQFTRVYYKKLRVV
jgi:hypothetical protein